MDHGTPLIDNRTLCEVQSEFCEVFTSPVRIRIMLLLADREMNVGEIAARLEVSLPNLSQHLRLMRDRLCVRCRKEGNNVYYRVSNPLFLEAMSLIRKGIAQAHEQRYAE